MKDRNVTGGSPPPAPSGEERAAPPGETGDLDDTSPLPKITSELSGIEVVEHSAGRAIGQWILQVRCQCGRRWFEVEAIDSTVCPRCKRLVYVDVLASKL
jgi:hypothetical protein